jgi:hypothetical protein
MQLSFQHPLLRHNQVFGGQMEKLWRESKNPDRYLSSLIQLFSLHRVIIDQSVVSELFRSGTTVRDMFLSMPADQVEQFAAQVFQLAKQEETFPLALKIRGRETSSLRGQRIDSPAGAGARHFVRLTKETPAIDPGPLRFLTLTVDRSAPGSTEHEFVAFNSDESALQAQNIVFKPAAAVLPAADVDRAVLAEIQRFLSANVRQPTNQEIWLRTFWDNRLSFIGLDSRLAGAKLEPTDPMWLFHSFFMPSANLAQSANSAPLSGMIDLPLSNGDRHVYRLSSDFALTNNDFKDPAYQLFGGAAVIEELYHQDPVSNILDVQRMVWQGNLVGQLQVMPQTYASFCLVAGQLNGPGPDA